MTSTSMFGSVKKEPAKKATPPKVVITISEEAHPGFSAIVKRLVHLRNNISESEAEATPLESDVKAIGVDTMLELYEKQESRPDSFILAGEQGGKLMVQVVDRYSGVPDEVRANSLRKEFGDRVVITSREFKFNTELLEKHEAAISEAIMNIKSMSDADKANLFTCTEKHAIEKGSIERLMQYPKEQRRKFLFEINPVVMLKNVR